MEDLRALSVDQLRDELARIPQRQARLRDEIYARLPDSFVNDVYIDSRRHQLEDLATRQKWIQTRLKNLTKKAVRRS